jgi:hypothetical protein
VVVRLSMEKSPYPIADMAAPETTQGR